MIALKPVLSAWLEEAEAAKRDPEGGNGVLPPGEKKRKRTSIAAPEKRSLEAYFAVQPRPSGEKIAAIAEKLDLKKNVVRVWFCNQRQKQKRMKFAAQAGLWGHHASLAAAAAAVAQAEEAAKAIWTSYHDSNQDYGDFYNSTLIKKEAAANQQTASAENEFAATMQQMPLNQQQNYWCNPFLFNTPWVNGEPTYYHTEFLGFQTFKDKTELPELVVFLKTKMPWIEPLFFQNTTTNSSQFYPFFDGHFWTMTTCWCKGDTN